MSKWQPISEPPEKSGWYLVFARSADPKMPFRHMSFYFADEQKWSGLVPVWQNAITHWADWPADPPKEDMQK